MKPNRQKKLIENVFFMQRAAIDVLLLNNATAIEICTYLVICKNTDRHGYESVVGYKTIKERLGVGQRKISEAIRRLKSMEFEGQRLLYSKGEWLYLKSGSLPRPQDDIGWVRGWFESEYKHQVWLQNDLVGNNGDAIRPLNYFAKVSSRDNHARMLLLLFKYHNRQYSGVNYKFASIYSEKMNNCSYKLNGYEFFKSRMCDYHISQNILHKIGLSIGQNEARILLSDLQDNNFMNVSISVLGIHDGPMIQAKIRQKRDYCRKASDRIPSHEQISAWKSFKENAVKNKDLRKTFSLAKIPVVKGGNSFSIGLKKSYRKDPLKEFSDVAFEPLADFPDDSFQGDSQYVYRLDYKSTKKRILDKGDCLAGQVEGIVQKCGLEPASRKGKHYDTYWWFNPGLSFVGLVGVIMPVHIPKTKLAEYKEINTVLEQLAAIEINDIQVACCTILPDYADN